MIQTIIPWSFSYLSGQFHQTPLIRSSNVPDRLTKEEIPQHTKQSCQNKKGDEGEYDVDHQWHDTNLFPGFRFASVLADRGDMLVLSSPWSLLTQQNMAPSSHSTAISLRPQITWCSALETTDAYAEIEYICFK